MEAKTYEKKQIRVRALKFEYTDEGISSLKDFVGKHLGSIQKERRLDAKAEAEIFTLEDGNNMKVKHIATEGDYVIEGIKGEFYPCKPDIFKQTYNTIEEIDLIDNSRIIDKKQRIKSLEAENDYLKSRCKELHDENESFKFKKFLKNDSKKELINKILAMNKTNMLNDENRKLCYNGWYEFLKDFDIKKIEKCQRK